MEEKESKTKEIILQISLAYMALYEDRIEDLAPIIGDIKDTSMSLKFEDLNLSAEMVEHLREAWKKENVGAGEITREQAEKLLVELFIRFVELSVKSCVSLMSYTMKDVLATKLMEILDNENN